VDDSSAYGAEVVSSEEAAAFLTSVTTAAVAASLDFVTSALVGTAFLWCFL